MKTIIIYGLKRSGNHFLISVILNQFSNYVHLNDIELSYDQYIKYKNKKKIMNRVDNKYSGFKNVQCVILSLENKIIDEDEINKFKIIDDCYFLILLRSPYCNFSSTWKINKKYKKNKLLEIIKLWKIYAKIFLNNNEYIKVIYDELSTNINYKINLLKNLGINNINFNNIKNIPYQKSSFYNNHNKGQIYKTKETCIYKNNKLFLNLVDDKEIDNLWNLIKKKFELI